MMEQSTIKLWYKGWATLAYDTYFEASYQINDDAIIINYTKTTGEPVTVAYNKENWVKMEIEG